jgi:hypothetical protein
MRKVGLVLGLLFFFPLWVHAHGGVDTSEGILNSTLHNVIPLAPLARGDWELRLLGGYVEGVGGKSNSYVTEYSMIRGQAASAAVSVGLFNRFVLSLLGSETSNTGPSSTGTEPGSMVPNVLGAHRSRGYTAAAGVTAYIVKRDHFRLPFYLGQTLNSVTAHLDLLPSGTFDDEYHGRGTLVCIAPQIEYWSVLLMPHFVHHERGHTRAGRGNGENGNYGGDILGITAAYRPWGVNATYTLGGDGIYSYLLGWSYRFGKSRS